MEHVTYIFMFYWNITFYFMLRTENYHSKRGDVIVYISYLACKVLFKSLQQKLIIISWAAGIVSKYRTTHLQLVLVCSHNYYTILCSKWVHADATTPTDLAMLSTIHPVSLVKYNKEHPVLYTIHSAYTEGMILSGTHFSFSLSQRGSIY